VSALHGGEDDRVLPQTIKLTALFVVALGASVRAEDWPEFRGPTGQGLVSQGKLPTEWSDTKNVAWKQDIPGLGWSSPIVHAGRIYLTSSVPVANDDKVDQSLAALCLDAKSGKIVWQKEVFRQDGKTAPRIHRKNSHASPTPLTDGKRLYVHFGHQGTACLDFDGKILWRSTSQKYDPVHGNGNTLILADDALVFNGDGDDKQFVVALDRATGKELWRTKRQSDSSKKFSFCTPLLINVKEQKQIVSPGAGAVCAYDPATGKEIWRVLYGNGYSVVPRPVHGHGLVFICTGFDAPELLAIRPDGQGDVTKTHIAWTARKGVPLTASLLLVGDELYMISDLGVASCLDAKTGKVHWQERIGGAFSASPLHCDGKIYFQSEEGVGVVINAGKKFDLVAKNNIGERTLASAAAVDGVLFIRTEKHLYCIQAR
jgi:outer membrane protein assembly factor BamB